MVVNKTLKEKYFVTVSIPLGRGKIRVQIVFLWQIVRHQTKNLEHHLESKSAAAAWLELIKIGYTI